MKQSSQNIFTDNFKKEIANLFPSYFALIMATGIVSIACYLLKIPFVGDALFYLNIVFYCVLWILFLCRLVFYFPTFVKDFSDHSRSPGFLTIVARVKKKDSFSYNSLFPLFLNANLRYTVVF